MMPDNIFYCYKVTNKINGKGYIGFTCNPRIRWNLHKADARKGRGYILHAAMRKYGEKNFEFEVICCGWDKRDMLQYVEPALIVQHQTAADLNGYNISRIQLLIADDAGSEEERKRISEASKRAWALKEGDDRSMARLKFTIVHTDGRQEITENLVKWCEDNEVKFQTAYSSAYRGNRTRQGYLFVPDGQPVVERSHEEIQAKRSASHKARFANGAKRTGGRKPQSFQVTHPDGTVETTDNLANWCDRAGIPFKTAYNAYHVGSRTRAGYAFSSL